MKVFSILALLLIPLRLFGQVPDEEWRYVILSTSMFPEEASGNWRLLQNIDSNTGIFRTSETGILIDEIGAHKISGYIINATNDTLPFRQITWSVTNFFTEVLIDKKWKRFQQYDPAPCGMGLGYTKLYPRSHCRFELGRTTSGSVRLPFRINLITENGVMLQSNIVEISCTKKQFRMIGKPISGYNF